MEDHTNSVSSSEIARDRPHNRKKWNCLDCGVKVYFYTEAELNSHYRSVHPSKIYCSCCYKLLLKKSWNKHLVTDKHKVNARGKPVLSL